jgi:hypothetical protein
MPSSAASNHEVKHQYINGHFCYAYKFGILVNGLGIVRSIDFYNNIPCCPHDPSLPMKREGSKSHLKSNLPTYAGTNTAALIFHRHITSKGHIESNIFRTHIARYVSSSTV